MMRGEEDHNTNTMVSDQDLAKAVETVLRQANRNAMTSLNDIVQQLEMKLGFELSHKVGFIRDQISLLLRPHPASQQPQALQFAPLHHQQYTQQFPSHFVLHNRPQHQTFSQDLNFQYSPTGLLPSLQPQPLPQLNPQVVKAEAFEQNVATASLVAETPKQSAQVGAKRKGGPGGLNKVCGVTPELEAVVGQPALPRTEIVKQLWAYIRKHNLQDPSNKRRIICDDALRLLFDTDSTDMFKMNKLLAKHIIKLEPTKLPGQDKRTKIEDGSATESAESSASMFIISGALAKFLGTEEREMQQSEASKLVWEHIKVNHLEDPLNSMVILCDAKLNELLGCESISALGINEMLARHHLIKRS